MVVAMLHPLLVVFSVLEALDCPLADSGHAVYKVRYLSGPMPAGLLKTNPSGIVSRTALGCG